MAVLEFDVVIVGASFGGVAAALAAAADPKVRVALVEAGAWVGGQATSQGVTRWDEAPAAFTEAGGTSTSYRALRTAIRDSYRSEGVISNVGRQQMFFNPGFARTGPPFERGGERKGHPFSADPRRVETILRGELDKLRPRLTVRTGATVTAAQVTGGTIRALTVTAGGTTDTYVATFYLDATELGDLLPLCRADFRIGAESQDQTHEHDAQPAPRPDFIQPITVPIAMELRPSDEDHTIDKPPRYDTIRHDQGFDPKPDKNGKLVFDGDITGVFTSNGAVDGDTLWNYRRYIDADNFVGLPARTTLNMKANDLQTRTLPTGSAQTDAEVFEEARAVSIAYAYYLQHDCPRDDRNGTGYPNLMVVDAFGTGDGTAPAPYVRESRRWANPRTLVVEEDILDGRGDSASRTNPLRARSFPDTCGIGWYNMDIHSLLAVGMPEHGFASKPFQIPLGALLSKTPPANLIAACKNIGTTHLTSSAYRVHPVEWAIGEAAGVLAAFCVTQGVAAADVHGDAGRLAAYQLRLLERGVPIFWWSDVVFEAVGADAFAAIHLLGMHGILEGEENLAFAPGALIDQAFRDAVDARVGPLQWTVDDTATRAAAAIFIAGALKLKPA